MVHESAFAAESECAGMMSQVCDVSLFPSNMQ